MDLLRIISEAWGWIGLKPRRVVRQNAFGNLLVEDQSGRYWRICPEELSCTVIADSSQQFKQLELDQDFRMDWEMSKLVSEAKARLGEPGEGRCFCLKIPGVLGGEYSIDNIGHISLEELIRASGDIAQKIEGLPDGTQVEFKVVD